MIDIWYDEGKVNKEVQEYLTTDKGTTNNVSKENVFVIFSKSCSSINSKRIYKVWRWILVKDDETDKWRIVDKKD